MARKSAPPCNNAVAKLWRKVWGGNGLLDACFLSLSLDHDEYHRASEVMTTAIEEHKVFLSGFDIKGERGQQTIGVTL